MPLKKSLKGWVTFTRRDRIGVIALACLLAIIYLLPKFFGQKQESVAIKKSDALTKAMDTLEGRAEKNYTASKENENNSFQYEPTQTKNFTTGELFQFDPNTLSVEGWQKLGLTERLSKTIDKYRSKGGKFYKPEDIQKIWGMPDGFFERVKGYIVIASQQPHFTQNNFAEKRFESKERKLTTININDADTTAFISLPGIGSKLAVRIVSFREKLGGFYAIEQIAETYGLPDSTFQKIKSRLQVNDVIRKFNLNNATKDELKTHPYFKWALANAIVEYRNQHGNFTNLEELKKIALVDEMVFSKIVHYLAL